MRPNLFYPCIWFLLMITACQTADKSYDNEGPKPAPPSWGQLLQELQEGRIDIQTLTEIQGETLEFLLDPFVSDPSQWSRLSYLITRLSLSASDSAHRLSLTMKAKLAFERKDYREVERLCLEILSVRPDHEASKLALGLLYVQTGQFAKAIPYLNERKQNPKALAALISAHRQEGNNDLVDALCEKYQSDRAELWEISYNCSLFEAQNMKSPEKALRILQASLDGQPRDSEASRQLRQAITRIEVARLQKEDTNVSL